MATDSKKLAGKVAVITGAAGGIGAATARLFARHGASLALLDRNTESAAEAAAECRAAGSPRVEVLAADVAVSKDVEDAFAQVQRIFGGTDILVCSAGMIDEGPFTELSEERFIRTVDVDLFGTVRAARAAVPQMITRGGGRMIFIASQIGIKGGVDLSHYAAAKAGVIGLTKALARELARHDILVNAIAPGPLTTSFMRDVSDAWKAEKMAELPLGRFGEAAEVAPTALLLASDPDGNLYTGQTLGPNSGDVMP